MTTTVRQAHFNFSCSIRGKYFEPGNNFESGNIVLPTSFAVHIPAGVFITVIPK